MNLILNTGGSLLIMSTINQLLKKKRSKKLKKYKAIILGHCPQKKGVCLKIFKLSPRKPNSARRSVAKIRLYNRKILTAFIPGEGHNLQKFNDVLVRGGRTKDLPGIRYRLIRNKLDLYGIATRRHGRSKYGTLHPYK
jgi:small subunit ribosomal protein S12